MCTLIAAIPCETPIIADAILSPAAPYTENQTLTVSCQTGYKLNGNSFIRCAVTTNLPTCQSKAFISFINIICYESVLCCNIGLTQSYYVPIKTKQK